MTDDKPVVAVLRDGSTVPVHAVEDVDYSDPSAVTLADLTKRFPSSQENELFALLHSEGPREWLLVAAEALNLRNTCLLLQDAQTSFLPQSSGRNVSQNWSWFLRLAQNFPEQLAKRAEDRSQRRIDQLLDLMLDSDPFGPIEAKIDAMNAEMRAEFLKDFPVLDSAQVHDQAGLTGSNKSQTVNTWRQKGLILGLPIQNKIGYPAFQFDGDGRPMTLMKSILKSLPREYTPWQKAFWMVSSQEALDGKTPVEALRAGDGSVVDAATRADELPVG